MPLKWEEHSTISHPSPYDIAKFKIGDDAEGQWEPVEELLRLDDRLRERFGFPTKMGAYVQPWATKERAHAKKCHLQMSSLSLHL